MGRRSSRPASACSAAGRSANLGEPRRGASTNPKIAGPRLDPIGPLVTGMGARRDGADLAPPATPLRRHRGRACQPAPSATLAGVDRTEAPLWKIGGMRSGMKGALLASLHSEPSPQPSKSAPTAPDYRAASDRSASAGAVTTGSPCDTVITRRSGIVARSPANFRTSAMSVMNRQR